MKIKHGSYAMYQDKEYVAEEVWDEDDAIQLFSDDRNDVQNGFVPDPLGVEGWVKVVTVQEVESFYSVTTHAEYKGHQFQLVQKGSNGLALGDSGRDSAIVNELGFTFIEPGVYMKEVTADELDRVWEEKKIHFEK